MLHHSYNRSRSTYHFHFLPRHSATHIRASRGWEQRCIAQIVDPLFPCLSCFLGWVDVFQTLAVDEIDRIFDPTALDFDG